MCHKHELINNISKNEKGKRGIRGGKKGEGMKRGFRKRGIMYHAHVSLPKMIM